MDHTHLVDPSCELVPSLAAEPPPWRGVSNYFSAATAQTLTQAWIIRRHVSMSASPKCGTCMLLTAAPRPHMTAQRERGNQLHMERDVR